MSFFHIHNLEFLLFLRHLKISSPIASLHHGMDPSKLPLHHDVPLGFSTPPTILPVFPTLSHLLLSLCCSFAYSRKYFLACVFIKSGKPQDYIERVICFMKNGSQWKVFVFAFFCVCVCGKKEIIVLNGYLVLVDFIPLCWLPTMAFECLTLWNLIIPGSKKCLFPVCTWWWPLSHSNLRTAAWSH